ncbi:MAG: hypothetical protein Ct9H300mP14_12260 [Gammaproteobacteria bacterium]|nr:MAG: hypothetical protein Ct9H300mP14_12260 [Gammaproteobacteria bacterium]
MDFQRLLSVTVRWGRRADCTKFPEFYEAGVRYVILDLVDPTKSGLTTWRFADEVLPLIGK